MAELTDYFVKGSNNKISKTLTEAGSAIAVTWTELKIFIGPTFTITRTAEEDGITFDAGVVEIDPGDLTEDLSTLTNDKHRVLFRVKTAQDPDGVYYGADDSGNKVYFEVTDPPS